MKIAIKVVVIVILVLGIVGGGVYAVYWYMGRNGQGPTLRTVTVNRGDVVSSIAASGTVEPEEEVDVGAQIAGQILTFGKDKNGKEIDYRSDVEEGTVLAQIDDSLYAADTAAAAAQLVQANASVTRAEADLGQMKAKLDQADRDWQRAQKLGPSEALAQSQYDAYKSGYDVAKANVAVGEAAIGQAKGAVAQAEATLQRVKRNLAYCTIKSPVKGVIIDRRVNIGQTVVSSLNAPSLFLIAKDLTRMEVWVQVNEVDVGSIYPGQPVSFTCDTFRGQTFRGEVGKVRLNATMTQNVVTYPVEVVTNNSDGKLLPFLTANIKFELARHDNVLMVPSYALRWSPAPERVAPEFREAFNNASARQDGGEPKAGGASKSESKAGAPSTEEPKAGSANTGETKAGGAGKGETKADGKAKSGGERPAGAGGRKGGTQAGTLWVKAGDFVRPVRVRVGLSDGAMTEVSGDELEEGMEVVVAEQKQETTTATTNPFATNLSRSRPPSKQ